MNRAYIKSVFEKIVSRRVVNFSEWLSYVERGANSFKEARSL